MEWAARINFDFSDPQRPYDRWEGVASAVVRRVITEESHAAMTMYRDAFKRVTERA